MTIEMDQYFRPFIDRWRLASDGAPFETHSSWLAPVMHGGKPALLKVFKPGSDETESAAILRHWGDSAARVYEADETAIVIERVSPGTQMTDLVQGDDNAATHAWCDTVAALHTRPAPEGWKDIERCGRSLLEKPYPNDDRLPRALFERARAEYRALLDSQSATRFLLHTDLHHANILKDDARGWIVIDPKGYAGELAFEAASFLHNPTREYCAPGHLERRVRIIAPRLGLDEERLLRWVFAHGVLSAVWSIEMPVYDPIGGVEAATAALEVLGGKFGA
jgi:streptomycin 6-kinase